MKIIANINPSSSRKRFTISIFSFLWLSGVPAQFCNLTTQHNKENNAPKRSPTNFTWPCNPRYHTIERLYLMCCLVYNFPTYITSTHHNFHSSNTKQQQSIKNSNFTNHKKSRWSVQENSSRWPENGKKLQPWEENASLSRQRSTKSAQAIIPLKWRRKGISSYIRTTEFDSQSRLLISTILYLGNCWECLKKNLGCPAADQSRCPVIHSSWDTLHRWCRGRQLNMWRNLCCCQWRLIDVHHLTLYINTIKLATIFCYLLAEILQWSFSKLQYRFGFLTNSYNCKVKQFLFFFMN